MPKNLRKMPRNVRYTYIAVSDKTIHTGTTHGGLVYANAHYNLKAVYLTDLATMRVVPVKESVEDFLNLWKANYDNPNWDYATGLIHASSVKG